MSIACRIVALVLPLALLGGCAGHDFRDLRRLLEPSGDALLRQGVRHYEQGRLTQAGEYLQEALDAGLAQPDQVTAHKYLAFIHCASKRQRQCRAHFNIALEIDPSFDLGPAEAADPAWGPTFRAVKARQERYRGS